MRKQLSDKYIRGRGLEIGGLHNPLPVLPGVLVEYIDRMSLEDLKATSDMKPIENRIIVDDAESLVTVLRSSQDFIIANHVLEHCHSPLRTLQVWLNKLRPGGIIYAAIPEKTKTFDRDRPITTLDHLLKDYASAEHMKAGDIEHYRDWHYHVDKLRGDELEARVELDVSLNANIHFHVWNLPAMLEMMNHPLVTAHGDIVEMGDNGAEIIWILRKR
jgi:SAM-dependent methyltransferase